MLTIYLLSTRLLGDLGLNHDEEGEGVDHADEDLARGPLGEHVPAIPQLQIPAPHIELSGAKVHER